MEKKVQKKRVKRKLRKEFILSMLVVGVVALGGSAVFMLSSMNTIKHKSVVLSDKVIKEQVKKPVKQVYFYPAYQDDFLNEEIQARIQSYKDIYGEDVELYVDYAPQETFDQYLHLAFEIRTIEAEQEVIEYEFMNYDLKNQVFLTLDDVFRRDYQQVLQAQGIDLTSNFVIQEKGIYFIETDQWVEYASHQELMKLKHAKIPSLFQEDVIIENKREFDPNQPMIAFTFDDGPRNFSALERIATTLINHNGNATFFMVGDQVEKYPELVKDLVANGFYIGNHTYGHHEYNYQNVEEIVASVLKTQDIIYQASGYEPRLYRPAGAFFDQKLMDALPYPIALWTIDAEDWKSRDADRIVSHVMDVAHNGGVVVFHDIYDATAEAIERLVPMLQAEGYQIVGLEDLMEHREKVGSLYNY